MKSILFSLLLVFIFNDKSKGQNSIGIAWQRTIGGSGFDYPSGLSITKGGDIVTIGYTNSNAGDIGMALQMQTRLTFLLIS